MSKIGYQTSQFDANPNRGESVFSHLADPPASAATAESAAVQKAKDRGAGVAGNATAALQRSLRTAHRDLVKAEWDSTAIPPEGGIVPRSVPRAAAAPPVVDEEETPAPAPRRRRKAKS